MSGCEAQHDSKTCTCSPESRPYPGLYPKQHGQQVKGGDSFPRHFPLETTTGILHLDWIVRNKNTELTKYDILSVQMLGVLFLYSVSLANLLR